MDETQKKIIKTLRQLQDSDMSNRDLYHEVNNLINSILLPGDISCSEFVAKYIKNHELKVDGMAVYDRHGDIILDYSALFYRIFEEYKQFCKLQGVRKYDFTEKNISTEFGSIIEDQVKEKRDTLRRCLANKPDKRMFEKALDTFCYHLFGRRCSRDTEEYRRNKAFIAHWIWQVLVKVFYGAPYVQKFGHESMLIFYSPSQKTGKSTVLRWFLDAFFEHKFVWKTDFSRLEDKFSMVNFFVNYIAVFDEMARASSVNMCKAKQIITDDEVSYRAPYSGRELRGAKIASLIGTSNISCRSLFNDTTGLRRFHEIQVNGRREGCIDLSDLENFDFSVLFTAFPLDKNKSPLFDYITPEELTRYEENIRPKHVVELWLEDSFYILSSKEDPDSELVSYLNLYNKFREWATLRGYKHPYIPNSESFNKKIEELGGHKGRTTKDKKTFRGFFLKMDKAAEGYVVL